jgi:hypothetical protein
MKLIVFIEMIVDLLPLARRIAFQRIPITRTQGYLTLLFDHLPGAGLRVRRFSGRQKEDTNISADRNDREASPRIPDRECPDDTRGILDRFPG